MVQECFRSFVHVSVSQSPISSRYDILMGSRHFCLYRYLNALSSFVVTVSSCSTSVSLVVNIFTVILNGSYIPCSGPL